MYTYVQPGLLACRPSDSSRFKTSVVCFIFSTRAVGSSLWARVSVNAAALRWRSRGWARWLLGWVLLALVGRTLAWVSWRGSGGTALRWEPCVCSGSRAWWRCWGAGASSCRLLNSLSFQPRDLPGGRWWQRAAAAPDGPGSPGQTKPPGTGWAACCQCPGRWSRWTDLAAACGPSPRPGGCSNVGGPAPGSPLCPTGWKKPQ